MPTRRFYVNSAPQQTLASGITNVATSCTIQSSFVGWPTNFPFFAVLEKGTASQEIVSVTNIVGLVATIVRGQDGTTGVTHNAGATLDQMFVRQDADEANAHTSANAGVHGISGNVVGDSDTQTLSNKTLTSPALTSPNVLSGNVNVAGVEALAPVSGTTRVDGIIAPKTYTNEAAANASSPGAGQIVYLTAPTGTGYSAGLFVSQGSGVFKPISNFLDAVLGSINGASNIPTVAVSNKIQSGKFTSSFSSVASTSGTLTFPTAFSTVPVVASTVEVNPANGDVILNWEPTPSASAFPWRLINKSNTAITSTVTVHWIAIGT